MYNALKKPSSAMGSLKLELGSWMYAILSKFTRDQFLHMVKNMKTDPALTDFYKRVKNAQITLNAINSMCTEKQAAFTAKPFFYSIKFHEGIQSQSTSDDQQQPPQQDNIIIFEIDAINQRKITVTDRIPTSGAFGSFANAISDVLMEQGQGEKTLQKINQESDILDGALKSQQEFFEQLELEKKRRAERQIEMLKKKEALLIDLQSNQIELETPSDEEIAETERTITERRLEEMKKQPLVKKPLSSKEAFIEAAAVAIADATVKIKMDEAAKAVKAAARRSARQFD